MSGRLKMYKLVVLGEGGVGKTALTIQLCLNHFVETYDPTIEDSYRKQVSVDGEPCLLEILDTAGQEEYHSLRHQWVRDGDGFVLVYSIEDRSSFNKIAVFHNLIRLVKDSTSSTLSPGYMPSDQSFSPKDRLPAILVGNKCDKEMTRAVSHQEGKNLAEKLGFDFIETSAKNTINVERAFFMVVKTLREKSPATPPTKSKIFPVGGGSESRSKILGSKRNKVCTIF